MSGLGPVLGSIVTSRDRPARYVAGAAQPEEGEQDQRHADDHRSTAGGAGRRPRPNFAATAKKFEERQQRLETRLENAEGLFRLASDYILSLRYHIAEGKPPPPPPFPVQLTKGLGGDR
jgi:hypothetical protein